jgi:hypothetical protein
MLPRKATPDALLARSSPKKNPGAPSRAAGAGRLSSWIDEHVLSHLSGGPQVV